MMTFGNISNDQCRLIEPGNVAGKKLIDAAVDATLSEMSDPWARWGKSDERTSQRGLHHMTLTREAANRLKVLNRLKNYVTW